LKLKNENAGLKASNDNHIYINEKLNKALQRMMTTHGPRKSLTKIKKVDDRVDEEK